MEHGMIAQLRGRLLSAHPTCVVEVGGVGFEVMVPEKDRESLSPDDSDVLFHTYLYVREDRLTLFGFLHQQDRELFMKLIDVTGIGPKLALGMIALHPAGRIVSAIKGGDNAFLRSLPGLGKKTAERVVIELADKLDDIEAAGEAVQAPSAIKDEVILALTSLGMSRRSAELALEKLSWRPDDDSISVEEVVKEALKYAGNI
jgi:Holliday junction DNA helicase RuvA